MVRTRALVWLAAVLMVTVKGAVWPPTTASVDGVKLQEREGTGVSVRGSAGRSSGSSDRQTGPSLLVTQLKVVRAEWIGPEELEGARNS
jgi:hypothetical protein